MRELTPFVPVNRALSGVVFKGYELVKELIENTSIQSGLRVKANIIDKVYEKGKKTCYPPLEPEVIS